jgi:UDP-glucose 4-epimerase
MSNVLDRKKVVVTGCAGFIGSNLVDKLLADGYLVVGLDNLDTGDLRFLKKARDNRNFILQLVDLQKSEKLPILFEESEIVFHLAANADVRFGPDKPRRDLELNTIVTHNVLEAMRLSSVTKIVFSSTGSIYGDCQITPTPETAPFPIQTSLYGASKLACEGLIQAYCESFNFQAWIFRFVSILGPRYSHGHIIDFYKQLLEHPDYLKVLGNGHQRKSYLHVLDCISGIEIALKNSNEKVNIFNLGVDDTCEVRDSITWMSNKLKVTPNLDFGTESQGWTGDNALIHLQTSKINSLGWMPKFSIKESIEGTLDYLEKNKWLLDITN